MKVRGDLQPSNAFSMEEQPNKPGFYLVRFYENAVPFEETKDGLTISGWEYDEYHLELSDTGNLQDDILSNFDYLLSQAKLDEANNKTIPELEAEIAQLSVEKSALATQLTETQLALCDVYEMIIGG